ncbi:hypothetical protein PKB_2060 [Pseudomonas knackmussii B13]|uniref:Uncharacterized protein n=1 Tax=Pseudomonas knackmussii (strain DSM 6978 / CCUG 54928 / LMG 23759 / B13) TaxID=1301098 RepID=A0A024HFY0_PSEKB|nr:DUF5677 domain-containing protein [Pseudomonas knackmussii]CDF83407.1 hypothetical protein PKB_2060 [Pseudomonas knackmussii B13]
MKPITEAPIVNRIEVYPDRVREFSNENDFTGLSVELLIEVGSYVCIAASILPPPPHRWNRHEAVVVGHLVRLYKLISAMLDQTCQHRRETTFVFGRLAFECIVNTLFLMKNDKPEVTASYIEYSMRHEKRLRDRILRNVEARGGETLHIEQRMLHSIESSAKQSGVDLDSINPPSNWGGKNLFEKAKDVGLEEAYLGAFAGPSHSVHGNWQDLLEYHLDSDEEGYSAELSWHRPRPQLLTTLALLTVETLHVFFSDIMGTSGKKLAEEMPDLRERIGLLVHLHEEFLARGANPA